MATNNNDTQFIQGLGLFDSTMIVAGSMIGSGIFIVSSDIARQVGSAWLLLAVWLITGLMTMMGALSFGELAASLPKAGGVYVFLKEAYNEVVGFMYGWTLLMVIQTGTIAAVGVATAKFFGVLFPWISHDIFLININNFHFLSTEQLIGISSIVILTAINCRGIKTGAFVQNVFTVTKVASLLALIAVGLFFVTEANLTTTLAVDVPVSPDHAKFIFGTLSVVAIAMVGALFSSDAWFGLTFVAGEIKNPSKTLPLALMLGTGIVCGLYLLANVAYVNILGLDGIQTASKDALGSVAMESIFGAVGATIMAVIILISTIGCNNGIILSGSRVFWAMAKDRLFFSKVGQLDKNTHAPVVSLILQCIWASILCLSGKYSDILDYVICSGLVFYILTILAVFILRRKYPDLPRPYKVIAYPFLPIIYIICASFIIINLLIYKPEYCWPGLIIVLSGIPVYYIWKFLSARKKKFNESRSEQ